jgi:hypothetical protein
MQEPKRCAQCGGMIGVYEPIIVVEATGARRTSLLVEPSGDNPVERLTYHEACRASVAKEEE